MRKHVEEDTVKLLVGKNVLIKINHGGVTHTGLLREFERNILTVVTQIGVKYVGLGGIQEIIEFKSLELLV